ncbi:hypothetical protein [Homoserinimonas hongtaonis]|uniref:Uncharacterized protein n=1 Tax=Homoserinimonas hongtaonis TaxID=2079791 RepID=A0A2U1SWS1_9MICO|nr:hypothetical protein [Salinibacterium hongtaonis]PWB96074.1 hypothetical protein DF220_11830 [Salinibacterium hongtaonis]
MPLSNKSLTVVASATLSACLLAGGIATIASTLPAEEGTTVLPVDGVTGTPRDSIADDTTGPKIDGGATDSPASALDSPAEQPDTQSAEGQSTEEAEEAEAVKTPAATETAPVTVEVPPAAPVAASPLPEQRPDRAQVIAAMHDYAVRLSSVNCPEWMRVAAAGLGKTGTGKIATDRFGADKNGTDKGLASDGGVASTPGKVTSEGPVLGTKPSASVPPPTPPVATQEPAAPHPGEQSQHSEGWKNSDRGWHKQTTPQQPAPQKSTQKQSTQKQSTQHGSDRGHRGSERGGWGGQQRGGGRG